MKTIEYREGSLWLLDQTLLPHEVTAIECRSHTGVGEAISMLRVRGAPSIGVAAAYGIVLAARTFSDRGLKGSALTWAITEAGEELRRTRPTAVNLSWALQRMRCVLTEIADRSPADLIADLESEAEHILHEDEKASWDMARFGSELIADGANVLTHCNTGALAASGFGTALGVIRHAHDDGKRIHVWVNETRPMLQGARLTAWELREADIPFTLITDSMAAHFMARGRVDLVMVGADRIAGNGDGANKVGTYGLAVLASAHSLPFYLVAPVSTVDLDTASGEDIEIEERDASEVASIRGVRVAPHGINVANPAFDVTPARLITAIVTNRGVARHPFVDSLEAAVHGAGLASEPVPSGATARIDEIAPPL